ncbi:hypothetical protein B296_00042766 [Ensete ventricosum]|uniref:Uncharacterized protein n=1 Tax=Ensete ventricosum TaxID=4639 RepID=A0A426Z388_ENSVE|nr:hypothetical protein B296_00042766 [Ensete ventricosum]
MVESHSDSHGAVREQGDLHGQQEPVISGPHDPGDQRQQLGDIAGMAPGEVLEVPAVLRQSERDRVAVDIVDLVLVAAAGAAPDPSGKRVETLESEGEGGFKGRDDGLHEATDRVGEGTEEETLDRISVQPHYVKEGERQRGFRQRSRCRRDLGSLHDAEGCR